jgi:hypothetical protein
MRSKTLGAGILAGCVGAITLSGCLVGGSNFSEDVAMAYEECRPGEIAFLTSKHGMQTVFDRCGSNNFNNFAWAPDGIHLYFRVTLAGHILNGERKTIQTISAPGALANGHWLDNDRVVLLLPPPKGEEGVTVSVFSRSRNKFTGIRAQLKEPRDVYAGDSPGTILLTDLDADGVRRLYRVDIMSGEITRTLDWLDTEINRFTHHVVAGVVTWSDTDGAAHLAKLDGSDHVTFPNATRAVIHPEGRYVALEYLGDPISPFDQRSWDEVSAQVREREIRRTKQWSERLPDWAPTEIQPPTIDIYDLERQERWTMTAVQGDNFEWYPSRNYYCSLRMWGVEGKELNKNVLLLDLAERLRMAEKGDIPLGLERSHAQNVSTETPPSSDG